MATTRSSRTEKLPNLQNGGLPESSEPYDVIIIGAGAAGLMCAREAGKRDRRVLLLEQAAKPGEKIRISGGGRCNFTNIYASDFQGGMMPYLSQNPRFCISALKRYRPEDFIALVDSYGIAWHEKTLGQLFCDESSKQIIDMLLTECRIADVTLQTETTVDYIEKRDGLFHLSTTRGDFTSPALVIATGGPSIPKMGASPFGYRIAEQFGLNVIPPRPALVPLTFSGPLKDKLATLAGVSVNAEVQFGKTVFRDALLFTHRGLSGPAILQISSYWREGRPIRINMAPDTDITAMLREAKESHPRQELATILAEYLPRRLARFICEESGISGRLADLSHKKLDHVARMIQDWQVLPNGTEGYRTAEVTLGGVDTDELSSRTFECKKIKGLYFIGEVVDVTGHLGGYNFQWAWASGHACGQAV
ncbi:NAD(P)/FAD-dependent oxidoreductase [Luteithermobacter gelatinilyticus]|uniref:NAD(P)/FAD-dependent oxidoreductase n=1 Tax=Luteithermobacter gelatinilyticus TaxID=2582913 RepID=UPI001105E401|nr:NAD(P)/FAD-dependent oxidoreductase [Luteithermobacter gelatinilyticus]